MTNEELLKAKQIYIETLEELDNNPILLQIQKRPIKKLIEEKITEIDKILEENKWEDSYYTWLDGNYQHRFWLYAYIYLILIH